MQMRKEFLEEDEGEGRRRKDEKWLRREAERRTKIVL